MCRCGEAHGFAPQTLRRPSMNLIFNEPDMCQACGVPSKVSKQHARQAPLENVPDLSPITVHLKQMIRHLYLILSNF